MLTLLLLAVLGFIIMTTSNAVNGNKFAIVWQLYGFSVWVCCYLFLGRFYMVFSFWNFKIKMIVLSYSYDFDCHLILEKFHSAVFFGYAPKCIGMISAVQDECILICECEPCLDGFPFMCSLTFFLYQCFFTYYVFMHQVFPHVAHQANLSPIFPNGVQGQDVMVGPTSR